MGYYTDYKLKAEPNIMGEKMNQLIIKRPYICKCNHIECICPESKDETRFRINEC